MAEKNTLSHYEKMTESPIGPLIIRLGIPTILSMLITNIYNMADTAFVGQLGTSASGAVGVVFGFMAILQAIGFLFGQGAGSILSRKLGGQDREAASVTASTGLFCAVSLALINAVFSGVFLDKVVRILGSTETIAPYAKAYISYIIFASPFMVSGFCLNAILRFEGKAFLGMIGLMTGAILNIIGDPILIFGFGMGIAGAGLATCVSQIISFCILFSMFIRGKTQSKLALKYIRCDFRLIGDIVGTGLPSLLRQGLNSVVVIVLNMEAAAYGDAAIAAMSIVSRIIYFVFSVSLGLGQGFQPVSGFNYGAKKYRRVREAYRFTFIASQIIMTVMVLVVFLMSGRMISIFQSDPEVVRIGTRALKLQLISQLAFPFSVVTEMILQSTGKKFEASLLSSLKAGIVFIPLLLILSRLRGLSGIQEAQPLANLLVVFPVAWCALRFFQELPKEDMEVLSDGK